MATVDGLNARARADLVGGMREFDAILFDAGGVLLLPSPHKTGRLIAPFGGSTEHGVLNRAHFSAAHAMDHARSDGDTADWPAYHRAYLRAAGVPARRLDAACDAFEAEFTHHFWQHPLPGATAVLAELAWRGIPIGIVSNAGGQVEGDLAALGICSTGLSGTGGSVLGGSAGADRGASGGSGPGTPGRADREAPGGASVLCVVDSHLVGVAKPDPAIFAPALDALGLPASPRIAYVGDTVFYDVRASAAAGLSPLLHDPEGFHRADPHPSGPHRTLADLRELLDLV
jgi:putative hydrolase of the HAD superfamily